MSVEVTLGLRPEHRELLQRLLQDHPAFDDAEVQVALELVDAALAHRSRGDAARSDYRFLLAHDGPRLTGYVCFGPTPMTRGTFDIYWLVTRGKDSGVAPALLSAMEQELQGEPARLVRVETSGRRDRGATRQLYLGAGYEDTARLEDFYGPGDDLVIFTRRLDGTRSPQPSRWDFESLHDMAFSYRDFTRERDFLRQCARRFGDGEPARVLEWACGRSRYLESFAQLADVECVGVDRSPDSIERARRLLGDLPGLTLVVGELRDHVVAPPVDLAFTMLSSIHTLGTEAEVVAHLTCCARSLRPGGVYVVEATHPRDLTVEGANETSWQHQEGDVQVEGHFRLQLERRDGQRVPAVLNLTCELEQTGERRQYSVESSWLVLDLEAWQRVIDQVPELELVARLGDLDVTSHAEQPTAWRLVLVLRRRG